MEVFSDVNACKGMIEQSILKYGHCAEHYYYCYLYNISSTEHGYFFRWEDDMSILAKHDTKNNEWFIFVGILAPLDKRITLMKEFLEYIFSKNAKKVWCEFIPEFRLAVMKDLKDSNYRVNKVNYSLTWPVFKMNEWHGDKMEGKDWKDLRYYWNRFFREHKVEFRAYTSEDRLIMRELVMRWKKERNGTDKTYDHYYLKTIDNDFIGYQTRVIIVDNKICGITAGYKLPNKDYYYSSIGIIVKEFDRIGEIANMDDLINLKKQSHEIVDFGGGESHLTEFKKKFKPSYFYTTDIFSIVKKPV
jgi:hypothetical protein